jgi:hypothetical protein
MPKMNKKKIAEEFPVSLNLRFRNEQEKSDFLGQLSDGWGEGVVYLTWDTSMSMSNADALIGVDPQDENREFLY